MTAAEIKAKDTARIARLISKPSSYTALHWSLVRAADRLLSL